jgi:hypothetical protein
MPRLNQRHDNARSDNQDHIQTSQQGNTGCMVLTDAKTYQPVQTATSAQCFTLGASHAGRWRVHQTYSYFPPLTGNGRSHVSMTAAASDRDQAAVATWHKTVVHVVEWVTAAAKGLSQNFRRKQRQRIWNGPCAAGWSQGWPAISKCTTSSTPNQGPLCVAERRSC